MRLYGKTKNEFLKSFVGQAIGDVRGSIAGVMGLRNHMAQRLSSTVRYITCREYWYSRGGCMCLRQSRTNPSYELLGMRATCQNCRPDSVVDETHELFALKYQPAQTTAS